MELDKVEFLENLYNSLCSVLIQNENKLIFAKEKGIILMLAIIKGKNPLLLSAVKVLTFAL
jgi:beta-catenin-like protein 1